MTSHDDSSVSSISVKRCKVTLLSCCRTKRSFWSHWILQLIQKFIYKCCNLRLKIQNIGQLIVCLKSLCLMPNWHMSGSLNSQQPTLWRTLYLFQNTCYQAFSTGRADLDSVSKESYQDATLILQLIRDNLVVGIRSASKLLLLISMRSLGTSLSSVERCFKYRTVAIYSINSVAYISFSFALQKASTVCDN